MIRSKASLTTILGVFLIGSTTLMSACTTRHEATPAQYANSSAITFKVKEKLLRDPHINSYRITVSTYKDTVTLSGVVNNHQQEERAIDLTRSVKGVKYVVDNLTVRHS